MGRLCAAPLLTLVRCQIFRNAAVQHFPKLTFHLCTGAGASERAAAVAARLGAVPAGLVLQVIRASQLHQAFWLQVVCRTHQLPAARPAGGGGGAERLRQVEHHGRGAMGAG